MGRKRSRVKYSKKIMGCHLSPKSAKEKFLVTDSSFFFHHQVAPFDGSDNKLSRP